MPPRREVAIDVPRLWEAAAIAEPASFLTSETLSRVTVPVTPPRLNWRMATEAVALVVSAPVKPARSKGCKCHRVKT